MERTEQTPIQRFETGSVESVTDTLVTEFRTSIELRGRELIRTTCSPGRMREWVLGYLFSEGYIACPEDIAEIQEADGNFSVGLAGSAPQELGALRPVESNLAATPQRLLETARDVVARARIFHATGGTHVMAIHGEDGPVSIVEDISRTCALEKAIGHALAQYADFSRCIAFLSSRVPSRMIAKLARCGVPIVAAVSAPTVDAVRLAESLHICLCGFVRGERLNIYPHGRRLGL